MVLNTNGSTLWVEEAADMIVLLMTTEGILVLLMKMDLIASLLQNQNRKRRRRQRISLTNQVEQVKERLHRVHHQLVAGEVAVHR